MKILILLVCLALLSDIDCKKKKSGGKKKGGKKSKSKGPPKPKPTNAPPAQITKEECDALTQKLDDVAPVVTDLRSNMTEAEDEIKELSSKLAESRALNFASSRTGVSAQDVVALWDYQLGGYTTKCGAQQVTGWTETLDVYYAAGAAAGTAGAVQATKLVTASSGTFTAPVAGYYNICAFFRFLKGGNSVDITLKVSGTRVAAFGDAIEYDWRSTGTCTIQKLAAAATVTIHLESGGGSDCIEETGWYYGKFNGYLISVS